MADTPPPRKVRPGCLWGCAVVLLCGVALFFFVVLLGAIGQAAESGLGFGRGGGQAVSETVVRAGTGTGKITVIPVGGVILSRSSGAFLPGEASYSEDLITLINRAAADPLVVALVLDLNTPGGEVTATDEVYHALMRARFPQGREAGERLPVIAVMRSVAASGGYYLAAAASHIVANRLSWTGSIGVLIPSYDYHVLLNDKLGITPEFYKSGELKDMLNGARPRQQLERQVAQDLVDEAFTEFAEIVAAGRNLTMEQVRGPGIGDARILTGAQALALGLVDELGYPEDAWNAAARLAGQPAAAVVEVRVQPSLMDILLRAQGPAGQSSVNRVVNGLPPTVKPGRLYYLCPLSF